MKKVFVSEDMDAACAMGGLSNVHVVYLPILQNYKWRSRLWLKIGWSRLDGFDEQMDLWAWLLSAQKGDMIHRREGLWYECVNLSKNTKHMLLFNYENQEFEALRLDFRPPQLTMEALSEMD